jgi:predicted hotdog family 3-hydroxylacyl-ACP dehydratase
MNFPQPAAKFLPHKPPMLFLERAVAIGAETTVCETTLDAKFEPFYAVGADGAAALPAHFLLEIIAQSIGVWAGFHTLEKGEPEKSGMFLGCRDFTSERDAYKRGETLRIEVKLLVLDGDTGSFEGAVFRPGGLGGKRVASAILTTHQVTWERLDALLDAQNITPAATNSPTPLPAPPSPPPFPPLP